ncbi:MAG: zinc ABC transporter substrate-binding protein [Notoacmeibacter sp.]|nr:zinc ABC transporter substrate-binding protein [Notoacmeibacter sp.]MCC0033616.1 zinc ABC transporter substrate-binding protein [Brucellaceae bacterium]
MRFARLSSLALALVVANAVPAAAGINVIASIKPVHSLVAAVMQGIGEPRLIVDGAGSPHTFALKPSQAVMLQDADVVFWVGHDLEAFLEKPLETAGSRAKSVSLLDAPGIVKLAPREGADFEKHDGHDDGSVHAHGRLDTHVWLDPVNAKAMLGEIRDTLVAADPDNAAAYQANAGKAMANLDALTAGVEKELEPVSARRFIVFHDAYHYFEARFGVSAAASLTLSPDVMPGAARIRDIRAKVRQLGATCIFAEPQFEPRLVATITEGTSARTGVLDPLGAGIPAGPGLYPQLIRTMAKALRDCLSSAM